jgi:hypothetical protein
LASDELVNFVCFSYVANFKLFSRKIITKSPAKVLIANSYFILSMSGALSGTKIFLCFRLNWLYSWMPITSAPIQLSHNIMERIEKFVFGGVVSKHPFAQIYQ